MYENSEAGPNHYQLLNVPRSAPINAVKKAYRNLSLELHPDKNKAPNAVEEFRKVKNAFDIISERGSSLLFDNVKDTVTDTVTNTNASTVYLLTLFIDVL